MPKGPAPPDVEARFIETIVALEKHGVNAITGDCGFMMYFQPLARRHTRLPVFLSALVQLPAVISCYAAHEVIAILTANGRTLEPMRSLINHECGIDIGQPRYLIVGCEKVAGFDAVARGARVDYNTTAPGIVSCASRCCKSTRAACAASYWSAPSCQCLPTTCARRRACPCLTRSRRPTSS